MTWTVNSVVKLSVLNCIPSLTCSLHWRLHCTCRIITFLKHCTCRIITFLKHEITYRAISLFGILPTAICSKLTPPSSDKDTVADSRGNLSRPKKRWSGCHQISIKIGHPTKLSIFVPFKTWRTLGLLRRTSHCPLGMVSYKMSYKINIKVSDFEEGNIVNNKQNLFGGTEWNLWTKRKIPRLSSLSTSEKGGNLAGQKLAQKRVATTTILRARHPWPVICSILSDTLPSPKSLHPSQPLLHLIL